MPIYEMELCENCNKEMNELEIKYFIYKIDFWNNKTCNDDTKNYLFKNGCALMLCSKECIGEYISELINGNKGD